MVKSFRELMRRGEKLIGTFMMTDSQEVLEILGEGGFEFVVIDEEHGGLQDVCYSNLVRTAEAAGVIPIFRTPGLVEDSVKRALDAGASGVMIPNVSSADDARMAVSLSKFPPIGHRGACPYVRANHYGEGDKQAYFRKSNEEVALILLVEGPEGVANFDEILEVEGVDAVFFGPFDLSVAMGIPGEIDDPRVVEAIRTMIHKANAKGVFAGMLGVDAAATQRWIQEGADFILVMQDTLLLLKACKDILAEIKAAVPAKAE